MPSAPAGRLQGLEQITPETGGVILDLGDGRQHALVYQQRQRRRTYTDPAGEFSTLVEELGRKLHPNAD